MTGGAAHPVRGGGLLEETFEILQEVEHGLATFQRDEVIVERVGTLTLIAGAVALGGALAIGVALSIAIHRRSRYVRTQRHEFLDADDLSTLVGAGGTSAPPDDFAIEN